MVAIGWRRLGDNGEELCRALDILLAGVESFKATVLRDGLGMDGEGEIGVRWKEMWCKDVLWTPTGTISNTEGAMFSLRRMKDAKKAMLSISNSLDQAIGTITEPVVQYSNEIGFAKLPDDVLAQIFEIHHLDELEENEGPRVLPHSPAILSLVCKRFRDIAVHLPSLWRYVSSYLTEGRLSLCAQRCRNPSVLIEYATELEDFLDYSRPYQEWEELNMRSRNEEYGHRFFNQLVPRVIEPFASLKRLRISNDRVERRQEELTDRTILEADELALASWRFPNVTCLELDTIVPSMTWRCPSVTRFELAFTPTVARSFAWDLRALRDFLQAMPLLASLELTFHDLVAFNHIDAPIVPLELPCLRSFSITLNGRPPLLIVSGFMDLIETKLLTKLSIRVKQRPCGSDWPPLPLVFPAQASDEVDGAWMQALFLRLDDNGFNSARAFPRVVDFTLDILIPKCDYPPFDSLFASLPNVRFLSLALPEFVEIDLMAWVEDYEGLGELQTMRIQEYVHPSDPKYTLFLSKFSLMAYWENFEKLEVIGSFRAESLEKYVGDKLVRTGESYGASFYPV